MNLKGLRVDSISAGGREPRYVGVQPTCWRRSDSDAHWQHCIFPLVIRFDSSALGSTIRARLSVLPLVTDGRQMPRVGRLAPVHNLTPDTTVLPRSACVEPDLIYPIRTPSTSSPRPCGSLLQLFFTILLELELSPLSRFSKAAADRRTFHTCQV